MEKAYLIGFRIGDLNVFQKSSDSSVIVKSNTTHSVQAQLLKTLFSQYGPIWISRSISSPCVYHFTTALNHSFRFLIPKHKLIPNWIMKSKKSFFSFMAGYSDAEGTIGIYDKRARFRIGSYDKRILRQIHSHLISFKIQNSFRLERKKGIYGKQKYNGDFYRIDIMDQKALSKCLSFLLPYLKHENRKHLAQVALENIQARILQN